MEKLIEQYTFRIPEALKVRLEKLSPEWKMKLNHELRVTCARIIHESKFNPEYYLSSEISLQIEEGE